MTKGEEETSVFGRGKGRKEGEEGGRCVIGCFTGKKKGEKDNCRGRKGGGLGVRFCRGGKTGRRKKQKKDEQESLEEEKKEGREERINGV